MNIDLQDYLQSRRSVPAPLLGEPGPDQLALNSMLRIASRVPDHGKLAPWRFVIYGREERQRGLPTLLTLAERAPDERDRRSRADKARAFAASPMVVGIISAPAAEHPKIPVWEQELSAGAACMNLVHAAHSFGFAAQWLTGWAAYDPEAAAFLGVCSGERVAGFIHIGTSTLPGTDRERPDLAALTTIWCPDSAGAQHAD